MRAWLAVAVLAAAAFALQRPPQLVLPGGIVGVTPQVTVCAGPGALLKDFHYQLIPNDINWGEEIQVKLSGNLSQTVSAANAIVSAKFDGIPVYSHTLNACALKPGVCPFPAGPFHYDIKHKLPSKLPISGAVELKVTLDSEPSGAEITCLDVKATLTSLKP